TEDTVAHEGEHFGFGPVKFEPKPVQKPCPPIEIGGTSPPALRRAGRLGDGWIETGCRDLGELEAKLAVILKHRGEAGRDHLPFEVSTTGGLVQDRDSVRRCRDIGVTRVIVAPPLTGGRTNPEQVADWANRFADELIAAV
ncbi:MAG TPA: LLM class flavin-dependent oxidoreductase, partial [Acidimicrobiales bacterium]|nr:LLM class flavin-dependent oxidoreductase [Acidimicrobiales bacterium]